MSRLLTRHQLLSLYHSTFTPGAFTTSTYEDRLVAYGNAVQSWLSSPESEDPRLPLSSLCLPQRIYGALRRAGYTYVDDVRNATDAQLLSARDFGPKGLRLLRDALSAALSAAPLSG
jgi:DNA-directed RNA polymerase alpha subunit